MPWHLTPELLHAVVPFAALGAKHPPAQRPLLTKLAEHAIIALAAAGLALWQQSRDNEREIAHIVSEIRTMREDARDANRATQAQIDRLQTALLTTKGNAK